jgi:uncharacterized protein (TIGR02996 family)
LSSDESEFVQAILAHPDDPTFRQVYADWLEERADPRAEFLRLEAALARQKMQKKSGKRIQTRLDELRKTIDTNWLAMMSQSRIERCPVDFKFKCPKQWDRLQPTDDLRVRCCDACQQSVHYCKTIKEAVGHARQGHCVAVDAGVPRPLYLWGRPGPSVRLMGRIRIGVRVRRHPPEPESDELYGPWQYRKKTRDLPRDGRRSRRGQPKDVRYNESDEIYQDD